jgi:UDP-N-acetylglucosamine 2-epimerase
MGERPDTILGVGCPSSDIARTLKPTLAPEILNASGSGRLIDTNAAFLLVVFHPTTTEFGGEGHQMIELLEALNRVKMQVVLLWPNIDAGADRISKAIRVFRNEVRPEWMRVITNLSPENYLKVIAQTACAVGNSSSFVRDASYFGTPIVLVGNRQQGREKDVHVRNVPPAADEITRAVREQLAHGPYAPSTLYGDGFVSERIAEALLRLTPYVQKRLNYVYEPAQVAAAHV